MDIQKNGELIIDSIFTLRDGYTEIQSLLREASEKNCIVYFKNEDLCIAPGDLNNTDTRAILNVYSMIISYPKAAADYLMYKLKEQ